VVEKSFNVEKDNNEDKKDKEDKEDKDICLWTSSNVPVHVQDKLNFAQFTTC
jgi:hypothetical protein